MPTTALTGMATSLCPQKCPSPEQHVGHLTVARIDHEALHLADFAVSGVDMLAVAHLGLAHRNDIVDGGGYAVSQAAADGHTGCAIADTPGSDIAVALDR